MNALGIVFSNIHDANIPELTQERTIGSIPFCGRYRLIDFALSSIVYSNIKKVGVITKSNYQSLLDHVGSGKDWDLALRQGGLNIIPPFGLKENSLYTTRLEALRGALNFLSRSTEEYVVMTDCDAVYTVDYNDVLKAHLENNADVTLLYIKKNISEIGSALNTIYLGLNEEKRVNELYFDLKEDKIANYYTNICLIRRSLLISLVRDGLSHNFTHFGKEVLYKNKDNLRIFGYELPNHFVPITSFQKYYKVSMDLLDRKFRDDVFRTVDVLTKVKDSVPTKYGKDVVVKNSLIADGCTIEGDVENSIIFRGVHISKGACVKNSIIMQGSFIGEKASLNCMVIDKNAVIKNKLVLSGCESHPFYIAKNSIIG